MPLQYRDYQAELDSDIYQAWEAGGSKNKNVLAVSPTGSGKTVLFSGVIKKEPGASIVIAHRNSLVMQISRALNRNEVPHRIIAQPDIIREAVKIHHVETGRSFYDPSARCGVCSLRTLISRAPKLHTWLTQVRLWVTDEAHHLLKSNSWGQAVELLPNARGLGVTATACRSDGMGLGAANDGVFHVMVEGRTLREMILDAWLVEYDLYAPPTDADFSKLTVTKSGDHSKQQLRAIEKNSHIVGDVVEHYLKLAPGKLGITFASNIETAKEITAKYNAMGVPAKLVHADTPEVERFEYERLFKQRKLLQLVNVDLFGEGYDLPELEVISMARKTESFGLFSQMCGRVLRPWYATGHPTDTVEQRRAAIAASIKPRGIIIDHVGNIARHGRPRYCEYTGEMFIDLCHAQWSLAPRERRSKRDPDLIPSITCPQCTGVYPGTSRTCPYCEKNSVPARRGNPKQVHGDLELLTPEALAQLTGKIDMVRKTPVEAQQEALFQGFGPIIARSRAIHQNRRLGALDDLGRSIDLWGGFHRAKGRTDSEIFRLFYFRFGLDILSARALDTKDALDLNEKLTNYLSEKHHVN